jgi:hypothetical protein
LNFLSTVDAECQLSGGKVLNQRVYSRANQCPPKNAGTAVVGGKDVANTRYKCNEQHHNKYRVTFVSCNGTIHKLYLELKLDGDWLFNASHIINFEEFFTNEVEHSGNEVCGELLNFSVEIAYAAVIKAS